MNPRSLIFFVLGSAALVSMNSQVAGQSKDLIIGTWVLDRGKSDFSPPNPLQRRTMIVEAVDNGFSCSTKTVTDREATVEVTYIARYDGKDVPIDNSALDTVSIRKIDAHTLERTGKIRGEPVETATMKISPDGKGLTITTKGQINDVSYNSLQIFSRQ